ncbi:MAG: class I SAM-dependent methyltransferase [Burkholderiales bacterium]|nr:class I SAM-dependent methyltransferase [Burkholderiales bacterium]
MTSSDWIVRWSHLLAPRGTVLDVACGSGRHLQWFAARGRGDRHRPGHRRARGDQAPSAQLVCADIENAPWPLLHLGIRAPFGAVVVTNYLWRPLMPTLLASVAPGGVLLFETFTSGQETIGRPARADFLLQPGELLRHCEDLHVVAYENGYLESPPRYVQRIAAVRARTPTETPQPPVRYPLQARDTG